MIKSIEFNGKFGYITEKLKKPEYPLSKNKNNGKLSDREKSLLASYNKKYEEWEAHKDEYLHPGLVRNLIGKKMQFSDKINLIFGPNASGKTTVLKAIAGNAGVTDGYTGMVRPSVLDSSLSARDPDMRNYLDKLMMNSAIIEWDGTPIYYDNFISKAGAELGSRGGSVLGNRFTDELFYTMYEKRISSGENSIFLINRLFDIAKTPISFKRIFSNFLNEDGTYKDMGVNDLWQTAYKTQLDYYMKFPMSCIDAPSTFLFDEIDKSLDILNVVNLYENVLPKFQKETNTQIIIISHSPIVLSDKIRCNENYNFISLDAKYTEACADKLNKIFQKP